MTMAADTMSSATEREKTNRDSEGDRDSDRDGDRDRGRYMERMLDP